MESPEGAAVNRRNGCKRWAWRRQRVINEQDCQCLFCGRRVQLTIDHIRPVADGGTDARRNLRATCARCHKLRHRLEDIASSEMPFAGRLALALVLFKPPSPEPGAIDRACDFLFRWFIHARRTPWARARFGASAASVP